MHIFCFTLLCERGGDVTILEHNLDEETNKGRGQRNIEEESRQSKEGESAQARTQIGENDLSSARSGSHCVYDLQNSGD